MRKRNKTKQNKTFLFIYFFKNFKEKKSITTVHNLRMDHNIHI